MVSYRNAFCGALTLAGALFLNGCGTMYARSREEDPTKRLRYYKERDMKSDAFIDAAEILINHMLDSRNRSSDGNASFQDRSAEAANGCKTSECVTEALMRYSESKKREREEKRERLRKLGW